MNGKPLMIVERSRAISLKEASKAIASFIQAHSLENSSPEALAVTNRERLSLVGEEIIENLSTIRTVIDEEGCGEHNSRSGSPIVKQKVIAKSSLSSRQLDTGTDFENEEASSSASTTVGTRNKDALHKELEKQAGADSESSDEAKELKSKKEKKEKKTKKEKSEKKEKREKKRKSESGEKTPKTKKVKHE